MIGGTNWSKVPCFRDTSMGGITAALVTGLGYHLWTSKPPYTVFFTTLLGFTIPFWYNYILSQSSYYDLSFQDKLSVEIH